MSAALDHQLPAARRHDLVITPLADELVIYDTAANQLHTLNPTAAFVWQQCDGQTSVSVIAQRFAQTYGMDDGSGLVWSALDQLDRQQLLKGRVERPVWLVDVSRRDLMKRAAAGALVALPLVRSLVAPTAAQAQSGTTTPGPCAGRFWKNGG
jgi:hypothetical protein